MYTGENLNFYFMDQSTSPSAPAPAQAPSPVPNAGLTSAGDLIRQSWRYYTNHLQRLLGITIVSWIIIAGATLLAGLGGYTTGKMPATPVFGLMMIVYVVVIMIAACWQYVSLIHAISPEGETKPWQDIYKTSKRWLWSYLGAAIITGLLTGLGFVLLIIPGIIIAVWFSFASFVVVNENLSPIAALKASRNYVRGKFWAVLGRWALFFLVTMGASVVVNLIGTLFGETGQNVLSMVFTLFLTPFVAVYGVHFYRDVKQHQS